MTLEKNSYFNEIMRSFNKEQYKSFGKEMSFQEYFDLLNENPRLARSAYQMIYDMIMAKGTSPVEKYRKTYTHYNFFDDPREPIIGLTEAKDAIVKFIKGAAGFYGPEKRVLLLHGPVGSSKSTICRVIKRGMEEYSRTDDGAWYSYKWVDLPIDQVNGIYNDTECPAAMNENPLRLLPLEMRQEVLARLNEKNREMSDGFCYDLRCEGDLNPRCKFFMDKLMETNDGDLEKVLSKHIRVLRKTYSESGRVGIGTFQPKDEKNQDSTELTGDLNFSLMSVFGSDSDPRTFNFGGEFCIANRGIIEFIEVLKLDQAFLYDLLGASQEQCIKPKNFSQVRIDEAIISHTNTPEYEKLKSNNYMEALKDRTIKVDVPYNLRWSDEIKILEKDYTEEKVNQHIAPHTIEIAALWAVLTRLQDDNDVSLLEKAELYDGKLLPSWTEDQVNEMMEKCEGEGMDSGVSIRYVQTKLANCISERRGHVNTFMILNELQAGLYNSSLITDKDEIGRYMNCITLAKQKLNEILKNEVQKALVGDEDAIKRLCSQYIDNVIAYNRGSSIKNPFTGRDEKPDERLMRSIEEKIDIPNSNSSAFREQIAAFIGELAHEGKTFQWDSNPRLKKALQMKLFEDVKDTVKLSALHVKGASIVDPDLQEKIDALKTRLIKQHGYNEDSAQDVLDYVGSIFARGDLAESDD